MITDQEIRNVKIGDTVQIYPRDMISFLKETCDYLKVDELVATVIGMGDTGNNRVLYFLNNIPSKTFGFVGGSYSNYNVKFDSSIQKGCPFFGASVQSIENLKIISSNSNNSSNSSNSNSMDSVEEERGGLAFL